MNTILVKTLPCPLCGDSATIEVMESEWKLLKNGAYIQDALSRLSPTIRERFISGTCGECWDKLFGGDED